MWIRNLTEPLRQQYLHYALNQTQSIMLMVSLFQSIYQTDIFMILKRYLIQDFDTVYRVHIRKSTSPTGLKKIRVYLHDILNPAMLQILFKNRNANQPRVICVG